MSAASACLQKMDSLDEDLRFMGLNDLAAGLSAGSMAVDSQIVHAAVKALGDQSSDVQNQAVKVVSLLAAAGPAVAELLVGGILARKAANAVRGVALKHVFQHGKVSQGTLDVVVKEHLSSSLFQTIEGVNALVELCRAVKVEQAAAIALTASLMRLISAGSKQIGIVLPVLDALSLTIPMVPESMWRSDVQPVLVAKAHSSFYLGLIAKLATCCPEAWLVPEISSAVLRQCEGPLDSKDVAVVEAALKALAALAASPAVREQYTAELLKTLQDCLNYREYGDVESNEHSSAHDGAQPGDLMTDGSDEEVFSNDSDWYDESTCIRQAASQLAAAMLLPRSSALVRNALLSEHDEATRGVMYSALAALSTASLSKTSNGGGSTVPAAPAAAAPAAAVPSATITAPSAGAGCGVAAGGPGEPPSLVELFADPLDDDLRQRRLLAVDTALRLIAQVNKALPADLMARAMGVSKPLVLKYIPYVQVDEARPELMNNILLTFLGSWQPNEVPENTMVQALELTRRAKASAALSPVLTILHKSEHSSVRAACLAALPSLIPADGSGAATNAAVAELKITLAEPTAGDEETVAALSALHEILLTSTDNAYFYGALESISALLRSERGSSSSDVVTKSLAIASDAPDAVAPVAAEFLASLDAPSLVPYVEKALLSTGRLLASPAVQQWAIRHESLSIISKLASAPELAGSVLANCLAHSASPDVHAAAAAAGGGSQWLELTKPYQFDSTAFRDLNEKQLRLLLALAQRRARWTWYSLDEIRQNATGRLQSEVFGTILAVVSGNAAADAEQLTRLGPALRGPAFLAYIKELRDPVTALDIMRQHPELRSAEAAAVAAPTERMLEQLAEKFGDCPELVVGTIKIVDMPDALASCWPVLARYVASKDYDGGVRSDALATIRWILQKQDPMPQSRLNETLSLAADTLTLDPALVQTVSIGPFKHKVDPAAVVRQTALDTVAALLGPHIELVSAAVVDKLARQLVTQSLSDQEHDVKIGAYRLISQLADLRMASLAPLRSEIEDKAVESLRQKLKESAVKQDVERHTELTRAINEARHKLDAKA